MWLRQALELLQPASPQLSWEPSLVALAHCLRKQQLYPEATQLYSRCVGG